MSTRYLYICSLAFLLAGCVSADRNRDPDLHWYRGDLHLHSRYSDGDGSITQVLDTAASRGLDFIALTDHDGKLAGIPSYWDDPAYRSDALVLLYGVEWSTDGGHANVLSSGPFDYSLIWLAHLNGDPVAAIDEAHAQGALFTVNHPAASRRSWSYGYEPAPDGIEVWNSVWVSFMFNARGVAAWDRLLCEGKRIPARGGSDMHQLTGIQSFVFTVGNPTTWVYALERTPEAILEGVQAGHVTISYAPDAERVDFLADADGDGVYETMVGDSIAEGGGREIAFRIRIRNGTGCSVSVIRNGEQFRQWTLEGRDGVDFTDTPRAGERAYYRVEVRGFTRLAPQVAQSFYGGLIALTNPIYVGY